MAKEFEIDAYRRNRELLIILRGRLVLNYCQDTKTRLFTLFSPQVDKVYLYLNELQFLDSAGLGVLVGLKMQANKNRASLVFLAPTPRVEDIFRVSKLDTIFDVLGGAEADVICAALRCDELMLWSDNKDSRQSQYMTEMKGDGVGYTTQGRLTPILDGADQAAQVRQHCDDAVEYIRQGNFTEAVNSYQKALDIEPESMTALNNLGIVYEKRAEWYGKATQVWQKVLEISQSHQDDKHAQRAMKHLDTLSKLMRR